MSSSRQFLLGAAACLVLAASQMQCHQAAEPVPAVTFQMLSPAMQQKLRATHPNIDKEWLRIVRETCKRSAFVNCVCCAPETVKPCNPINWECCGSAVFSPADGSACAIPAPCNCTMPVTPLPTG